MNRHAPRSALAVVTGAMLVLGFAAPAVARDKSDDGDRKEQQDQRKGKAHAKAGQPVDDAVPSGQAGESRHAGRDEQRNQQQAKHQQARQQQAKRPQPIERRHVEDRGERIRGDDEKRLQMQQRHAREQAEQREAISRQQAERRSDGARRAYDQRRAQQERIEPQRGDRQQRLSGQQQRRLIAEQRQRAQAYQQRIDAQQALARQRAYTLQEQQRMAQYRYQQDYYQRLYRQQSQWASQRYDYYNDPFFYTPANYRYSFGGQRYETNRYGADLLRDAVRQGYQEGLRAGRADRMDGWRPDYRTAYAYQDANYGYNGYYVRQDAYNHYFRQGFRRGYDDGHQDAYRYGRYNNGSASILPTVLSTILGLQLFN
jgi:hypothetical protein